MGLADTLLEAEDGASKSELGAKDCPELQP